LHHRIVLTVKDNREESIVKLYLKGIVLILTVYAVAGCLPYEQVVSSDRRPGPEQTGNVSSSSALEETRAPVVSRKEDLDGWNDKSTLQTLDDSPKTGLETRVQPSVAVDRSETKKPKKAQQVLDEALEFCRTSQDFWSQGDLENGVSALDQAYTLLLGVDTNDDPKLIQQKEDIRFMICKRMLEIYTSRHTVAKGNHNAIPMVMNKYVKKEIKLFQGRERKFFVSSYQRSGKYRAEIVKALEEAGLPKELSWLPLIESGFIHPVNRIQIRS
jgi:membrane-bound lytic murein transglycosylase D